MNAILRAYCASPADIVIQSLDKVIKMLLLPSHGANGRYESY